MHFGCLCTVQVCAEFVIYPYIISLDVRHVEMCKKIIVGTYILNCLTKSQWMDIGKKQCERVLQDQPAKLANSRVCYSFSNGVLVY